MASTARIPEAEITGLLGAIAKRVSKKRLGKVPEAIGIAWHNKSVLEFSSGLGHKGQQRERV